MRGLGARVQGAGGNDYIVRKRRDKERCVSVVRWGLPSVYIMTMTMTMWCGVEQTEDRKEKEKGETEH